MADYLKLFQNDSEYTQWENSSDYLTPNVCKIVETETIIYNGYKEENINYAEEYFTIESLEDENAFTLTNNTTPVLYYSLNKSNWVEFKENGVVEMKKGDKVRLKGNLLPLQGYGIGQFIAMKKYNVKGNSMSLILGDEFKSLTDLGENIVLDTKYQYLFTNLFYSSTTLVDASNLILPATTLSVSCYYNMFRNCTSLVSAPELPATTLSLGCYESMFQGCTSLVSAPSILPATTLGTTLSPASSCYQSMFEGCTSLTKAPVLPATKLTSGCYSRMFKDCSNLNYIKMLYKKGVLESTSSYLSNWVQGVSPTGIFVKNPSTSSLGTGSNGIPEGWTVINDGEDA